MQEVHPIHGGGGVGVGGRLFGDRRLRPQGHHPNNQQSLKCPRCDSSNTKFCYYNNYNLSQPRHFCKNCRRYWTKGGVLRNVPVGGGCRKSKRSSKHKAKHSSTSLSTKTSHSHSSSESSSNNNTATGSAVSNNNNNSGTRGLFQISEADHNNNNFSLRNLDEDNNNLFLSGEFMSLMNNGDHNNNNSPLYDGANNGTNNTSTASFSQFSTVGVGGGVHSWDIGGKLSGANELENDDQTVTIDGLLQNRGGSSGGIATLDWQHPTAENGHHHQGLFDFPSTVDHQSYWNQSTATIDDHHTHWSHNSNDQPLFLP